jgi:hypothetical protein
MKQDSYKKIERSAEMLAEHIAEARNYAATLESICNRATTHRPILLHNAHFFATIKTALWGSLILNLHHCLDQNRKALSFHGLFRQISKCLPEEKTLTKEMNRRYQDLRKTKEAERVLRWRSETVAHVAHDHESYHEFLQDVPCNFQDINRLLTECETLLDECRRAFPDLRIAKVLSSHVQAESGVTAVMEALKMANKHLEHISDSANAV